MSLSSFAQVVIEERIEIGGITSKDNLKKGSSMVYSDSVVSGFIMPRSGVLQVYYSYINHFDRELPIYSTLNSYFFKGDSTSVDSLTNRFTSYIIDPRTYYNYCPPAGWEERDVWMYLSPDPYLYELGNINEGDSVQMIYHSDALGVETDIPISYADEVWVNGELVGWDVTFAYYDACILEYANELQLFVGVVKEYELMVSIEPDEIAPGDTADVILKKKLPDGTLLDFDSTQTFEVGMLEGCMSGKLIVGTPPDTGSYFYNVYQPIKFAAADSLVGDSTGIVILRVGIVDSAVEYTSDKILAETSQSNNKSLLKEKIRKIPHRFEYYKKTENSSSDTLSLYCFNPTFWQSEVFKDDTTTIKKHEILLGETKYYQAKRKTSTGKLDIEEIEPDENGVPQQKIGIENGWEWITTDVWQNNPVSVVECDTCGEKMGVYWEKDKPMVNGQNLPAGLIRLVGKYWHEDSTYIAKLKVSYNDDSTAININLKKPELLGNSTLARNLNNGIDIESNDYSVDSVCIKWGGQYGFPPQYIKGQYAAESVYDNILQRVTPGYRYEAWSTEFRVHRDTRIRNGHFWVTWEGMGSGNAVPNHENTRYMSYVNTPHSVWYFIEHYSNIVQNPSPYGGDPILGYRNQNNNRLSFNDYTRPSESYREIRRRIYRDQRLNETVENPQANELARIEFIEYMRYNYEEGLENRAAQSRVASSYGPLQPLYSTVIMRNYPYASTDDLPENLNDLDIFWPFAMNHFEFLLRDQVSNSVNNWTLGFEATLRIVYTNWNPWKSGYANTVFNYSSRFNPMLSEGE